MRRERGSWTWRSGGVRGPDDWVGFLTILAELGV
jgi:hypothetical protein